MLVEVIMAEKVLVVAGASGNCMRPTKNIAVKQLFTATMCTQVRFCVWHATLLDVALMLKLHAS